MYKISTMYVTCKANIKILIILKNYILLKFRLNKKYT
jgi:hypothetical protein